MSPDRIRTSCTSRSRRPTLINQPRPATESGESTEPTPPGAAAVPAAGGNPPATQQAGGRGTPAQQAPAGAAVGVDVVATTSGATTEGRTRDSHAPRGGQRPQTLTPPPLDIGRGGIFRSENKGSGWVQVSNCNSRPMYFSQLRVDPSNDKAIYVAGLPVAKSLDGGRTFVTLNGAGGNGEPGHVDQHAIWIDPTKSEAHPDRQRRRPEHHLGPGQDLGLREHDGDVTRVLGQRRHAKAVLRLHRPAGQRQLGRAERDAQHERDHELRLVRDRRRRRLPDSRGSGPTSTSSTANHRTGTRAATTCAAAGDK